ncbi:MAG TPA: trypsin-like peptidase domain-containing protein [Solirubrobacteraceae bacterium]|nr:trypsin-like peptidase domain-containing protein [Solirubrobacteraceae bacterium]
MLVGGGTATGLALAQSAPVGSGVVVINVRSSYGAGAGTGMVLTSSGEVLTNNHVIEGASSIRVVVPQTGKRYTAKVVGYDVTHDVALLQMQGAPNLKAVTVGDSASLKVGQKVTAKGNAGGTGSLTTTSGKVTALARSITVQDDNGGSSRLTGLIETDANLQPGDSGGPLLDSAGRVIGMDAAGEVGHGYGLQADQSSDGYAIPIGRAISIVKQIEAGRASSTVHVGETAYLGVVVTDQADGTGAAIAAVMPDEPAAAAGLTAGDVITAIAGHSVTTASQLGSLLLRQSAGAHVTVSYQDQLGQSQTATVTLGSGPAQ